MLRLALAVLLLVSGPGSSWSQLGAKSPGPEEKEARLKALASLLESFSDDEYEDALGMVPEKKAQSRHLASRDAVLKSAYTTLASVEYRKAASAAPQEASAKYSDALERVGGTGTGAQEAGLAVDVLKFLGNAALNYWMKGGQDFLGGKGERAGVLQQSDQELASAGISDEMKAQLHFKKGQTYEEAAAAIVPESDEERAAKKKARLKDLSALLQTFTDEEYKEAIQSLPPAAAADPHLASRDSVLSSAYVTLAALEYRDAAKQAPPHQEASLWYTTEADRLARDEAKNLAVNPETKKESHWMRNLLGIAAVGGIGYLVYENQRTKKKARRQVAEARAQSKARQGVLECPAGTRQQGDKCIGEMTCPASTRRAGEQCVGDKICPAGTRLDGERCMGAMTCPGATHRDGDRCMAEISCPAGTQKSGNQCIGERICPENTKLSGKQCIGERACPEQTTLAGNQCIGDIKCPAKTRLVNGECRGEHACPGKTKLVDGECIGDIVCPGHSRFVKGHCRGERNCPKGTRLEGYPADDDNEDEGRGRKCMGDMVCPENSAAADGRCQGELFCPEGTERQGNRCMADITCPNGTSRSGHLCLAPAVCPDGTRQTAKGCEGPVVCLAGSLQGNVCVAPLACNPPARLDGTKCVAPMGCVHPSILTGDQCTIPVSCRGGAKLEYVGNELKCIGQFNCPPGTNRSGDGCEGAITCPPGTEKSGNQCLGGLVCPSGTQVRGTQCIGDDKCPPGTTLHFDDAGRPHAAVPASASASPRGDPVPAPGRIDNSKIILCVACPLGQRLVNGNCAPCAQSPWGCRNNIHNVSLAIPLHESVEEVETQLAGADLDPGRRAELRHLLGSLYEDLAADARGQYARAPASAPSRPANPAPPGAAPQRSERPAEAPPAARESPRPAERPARAEKRKPAPPPAAEDKPEQEEEPSFEEKMRRQREDFEKGQREMLKNFGR